MSPTHTRLQSRPEGAGVDAAWNAQPSRYQAYADYPTSLVKSSYVDPLLGDPTAATRDGLLRGCQLRRGGDRYGRSWLRTIRFDVRR